MRGTRLEPTTKIDAWTHVYETMSDDKSGGTGGGPGGTGVRGQACDLGCGNDRRANGSMMVPTQSETCAHMRSIPSWRTTSIVY